VEREAAMARLQAELKASQDQMAEEQLKFQLRQDQDRAEMQSEKEAHKARMEQLQQQMNRQAEEIKKKAAGMFFIILQLSVRIALTHVFIGSQTDWGTCSYSRRIRLCDVCY
jgi:hypothetical protein